MHKNKDKLNAEYLSACLTKPWAKINVFEELDSTSNWLKTQAQSPMVCLAEKQTKGRGRNGNQWRSPDAENIYLSFSWVFESLPKHLPLLSLWVGITIAETLKTLGIENHGIKWPNDLYWQHKKLGGVLIETSSASSRLIVGIGINANAEIMEEVDQPWTSLSAMTGKNIDRNKLLATLLDDLFVAMACFPSLDVNELQSRWAKWDLIKGKPVTFLQGHEQFEGSAQGIDDAGNLLVKMESGHIKSFNTSISRVRW